MQTRFPPVYYMDKNAEVIVAGAGPAGAIAAYELAVRGIQVLVLEKSVFPRYKVCGAGLTHKILKEIPFDLSGIIETTIYNICFSAQCKDAFQRTSDNPMIYCTMREKLDAFLLEKATAAGAKVHFGEAVTGVFQTPGGVKVQTRNGMYRGALLIGADGATSRVSRTTGLNKNIMMGMAWEAEVLTDRAFLTRYAQTVFLDWGTFPGGYGWVFPKSDHFSIGVGGPATLSKYMIPYYQQFLKYLENGCGLPDQEAGLRILGTISLKAWPIPVRIQKSVFHQGSVLVTGDAGGLTDPLTGEGIYCAVRSGSLAAAACVEYLQGQVGSLQKYTEAVNHELMDELLEANRIKNLFNTIPRKIHYLVRDHDRVWGAFGKILRGERWYADVKNGFGPWKFLWGLSCLISRWISNHREKNYKKNATIRER